ncbi:hypothetical protein BKA62DRAFT_4476 [Auriculariales sp. MPI-PUGE-AT-0066]|nr:hypothetical protein BKA62DRAFT_4476 [Auriculariales sp. MPI-PUGE-AT-0066]
MNRAQMMKTRKADEQTLSTRKIRAMPKRLGGTPIASSGNSGPLSTTSLPKFAGFGGGFAATTTTTSSTFSLSKSAEPAASAFSATPKEPTTATKTFASILANNPMSTPPRTPTSTDDDSDELFKYYTQLRGLNVSFTDACKKALQADPFTDLSSVFSQYSAHRATIEKTVPNAKENSKSDASVAATAAPALKPPSVPSSFSFGGSAFPITTSTTKHDTKSGPVTFNAFAPTASTPAAPTLPLGLSSDNPASPPKPTGSSFLFGASSSDTSKSLFGSSTSPTKSGFSLGASSGDQSESTTAAQKPATFSFGTPPVSAGDKPVSLFGNSTADDNSKPLPFSFGNVSSPFGASSMFGSGASSTTPPTAPAASANPSSSSGGTFNTVGFAFGSGSSTPTSTVATPAATGGASTPTPAEAAGEGSGLALELSVYDKEGPGEEDEETVYTTRCKVYKLEKSKETDKMEWQDKGVGYIRLKKHKESGKRRVLLRNSGSGHVQLNFTVFKSLKPKAEKSFVSFVIVEENGPVSIRIKVKTAADAKELQDAIQNEVDAL